MIERAEKVIRNFAGETCEKGHELQKFRVFSRVSRAKSVRLLIGSLAQPDWNCERKNTGKNKGRIGIGADRTNGGQDIPVVQIRGRGRLSAVRLEIFVYQLRAGRPACFSNPKTAEGS